MSVMVTREIRCDLCGKIIPDCIWKVTRQNYLGGKLSVVFPNWHSPQTYDFCFQCWCDLDNWICMKKKENSNVGKSDT